MESGAKVYAVAKFRLGAATTVALQVEGAEAFWVDGAPAKNGTQAFSSGGEHTLVVPLLKGALPTVLRASATNARFVAQ
jgi:hypothetical protein